MSVLRIDTSHWPIVLTIFNGQQTEAEVDAYIAQMDAIYDRHEPFIGASFMLRYRSDLKQLRRIAEWTRKRADVVERHCQALVIVAPSAAFRFIFSSFLMIQPVSMPYTIVADTDAAADWLERELANAPVRLPARARTYLAAQMKRERAGA
jgi:hypothetical protein